MFVYSNFIFSELFLVNFCFIVGFLLFFNTPQKEAKQVKMKNKWLCGFFSLHLRFFFVISIYFNVLQKWSHVIFINTTIFLYGAVFMRIHSHKLSQLIFFCQLYLAWNENAATTHVDVNMYKSLLSINRKSTDVVHSILNNVNMSHVIHHNIYVLRNVYGNMTIATTTTPVTTKEECAQNIVNHFQDRK